MEGKKIYRSFRLITSNLFRGVIRKFYREELERDE